MAGRGPSGSASFRGSHKVIIPTWQGQDLARSCAPVTPGSVLTSVYEAVSWWRGPAVVTFIPPCICQKDIPPSKDLNWARPHKAEGHSARSMSPSCPCFPLSCEQNCRPVNSDDDVLLRVTLQGDALEALFSWYLDSPSAEQVRR